MRCHKSGVGLLPCCGERENYIGAQGDGQDNWQNVLAGGLNARQFPSQTRQWGQKSFWSFILVFTLRAIWKPIFFNFNIWLLSFALFCFVFSLWIKFFSCLFDENDKQICSSMIEWKSYEICFVLTRKDSKICIIVFPFLLNFRSQRFTPLILTYSKTHLSRKILYTKNKDGHRML